MSFKIFILFIFTTIVFSCSTLEKEDGIIESNIDKGKIEVLFRGSQSKEITRTTIDEDLASTKWSKDDFIYVWATSDETTYPIEAVPFGIKYFGTTFDVAIFTANINSMEEGDYSYYGTYPEPKTKAGTVVNYTIPSEQNGVYDGSLDIMVANPVVNSKLEEHKENDFGFSFRHLMHVVRVEIPAGRNHLGESISRLDITFPQEVVGDISFDVTTKDVVPTFLNGSKNISIKFETPISGDNQYAWVFINPTILSGEISFVGYDANGYRSGSISTNINKEMKAGRITPLTLTILPELEFTTITMDVTENNLGEEIQKVMFTAPAGVFFRNGKQMCELPYDLSNSYNLSYYTELYDAELREKGIAVSYESEHALVNGKPVILNTENKMNIQVPYLFFEDFSGVHTFEFHDRPGFGTTIDSGNKDKTIDLSTKGIANGWTGGRVGAEAGKSIRMACREETGVGIQNLYEGRIDSPPLQGIKSNAKIKVTYKYSGGKNESGRNKGTPKYSYGYTIIGGEISGEQEIENTIEQNIVQGTDGSFNNVHKSNSYELDGCSNITRLSWRATATRNKSFWGQNGNYWLYIDDIKVQIIK